MKNNTSITFVTTNADIYSTSHPIFLLIHERKGYILGYKIQYTNEMREEFFVDLNPSDFFGYQNVAITSAIRKGLEDNLIEGKVVWCNSRSTVNSNWPFGIQPHLDNSLLVIGNIQGIPPEVLEEIVRMAKPLCLWRGNRFSGT
jgi:hypothetical protein